MDQSQTSMYVSLRQLVWSAVIGVLSFQVIAPTVWGYVNSILGISFYVGYVSFVLIYALTLLVITALWLVYNRQPLNECLTGSRILCRVFLSGIMASLLIQGVAVAYFLTRFTATPAQFATLQVVILFINTSLLIISASIAHNRIKKFTGNTADKRVRATRDAAGRIITGSAAAVGILIAFAFFHWHHNQSRYYTGTADGIRAGFKYFDEGRKLDSLVAAVRYQADTLSIASTNASLSIAYGNITTGTQHPADTSYSQRVTSAASSVYITSLQHTRTVATPRSNTTTQQQAVYTQAQRDSMRIASLSSRYKKYADLLAQQKDLTLRIGQKQVGKLLRDHQIKLTYLFINVFILLIALFLFFRIDYLLKEFTFKESERASALYPGNFEFKDALLRADDTRKVSLRLVSDIWLYVTIAVWLLVPLFKPVEDDKINAATPFKALTFSTPGGPWQWFNNPNVDVTVKTENTVLVTDQGLQLIIELHADMAKLNTLLSEISDNTQSIVDGNKQLIGNTREIIQTNNALIGKSDLLINRCDKLIIQCDALIKNTDIISKRIQ